MKKNLFSVLLLTLMVAALMLSAVGCSQQSDDSAARIAELEQENAHLRAQLEELTANTSGAAQSAALQTCSLDAQAWPDGEGATVTFTASPIAYDDGMRAALSVRMGDLEAESTNCVWDGASFTGSVELAAVDGYSYYCILTTADGTQNEIPLNSDEILVYLGSSLTAYANLIVEEWSADKDALSIDSGYVQVQLPRLSDSTAAIASADLVLTRNGEEVERQPLTLPEGEGEGSYELELSGTTFHMPEMEDDYQLNLMLEVSLNNGTSVSASGGNWHSNSGELLLVVG